MTNLHNGMDLRIYLLSVCILFLVIQYITIRIENQLGEVVRNQITNGHDRV